MGFRELFKRMLRVVNEGEHNHLELPSSCEAHATDEHKDINIMPLAYEAEEAFYEAEQHAFEDLKNDAWMYEEAHYESRETNLAKPTESEMILSPAYEEKPYESPYAASVEKATEVHSDQVATTSTQKVERGLHEAEQPFGRIDVTTRISEEEDIASGPQFSDQQSTSSLGRCIMKPTSIPVPENHGHSRPRLSLKKNRRRTLSKGIQRIGNKTLILNKDTETGLCFSPRTIQAPRNITNETTSTPKEADFHIEGEGYTAVAEQDLPASTPAASITDAERYPVHQNTMAPFIGEYEKSRCSEKSEIAKSFSSPEAEVPVSSPKGLAKDEIYLKEPLSSSARTAAGKAEGRPTHASRKAAHASRSSLPLADTEDSWDNLDIVGDDDLEDCDPKLLFDDREMFEELLGEPELLGASMEERQYLVEDDNDEFESFFDDGMEDEELFDEDLNSLEAVQGEPERISQYLRACQKAAEFIQRNNWDEIYLYTLAEVLNTRGYGAILIHLQRHSDDGMVPEEFLLAIQLKAFWSQNRMLWMAFSRNGNSDSTYRVLSWAQCLRIIRMFSSSMEAIPQIEEVERFIEELFEEWYENDGLRQYFRAFSKYLNYVVFNVEPYTPWHMQLKWDADDLEPEDVPGWVPSDPMHNYLRSQLTHYGVISMLSHPHEAKTRFDPRYQDPLYSPAIDTRKKLISKIEECDEKKVDNDKVIDNASLSVNPGEAESISLNSGKSVNKRAKPCSSEEIISSLQSLFLKGYSKEEAARIMGLNQIEINNYLRAMQ
ncbi:MAG: hypothetical protein UMU75_07090 [Halomonas sp.]|nr:hypothetical protein [Halomonas sp.]